MRILAYDLSLRSTGVAVLDSGLLASHTLKTTRSIDLQDAVMAQVVNVVKFFHPKPDVVLIESGALGATRFKGYEELGALRWVVRDHVRKNLGMDVVEISPSHLKKAVTGNGRADKKGVMIAVAVEAYQQGWPEPKNNDEADAMGLIITYLKDTHGLQGAEVAGAGGTADGTVPF